MVEINWRDLVARILSSLMISQCELAQRCRVSPQAVSSWKNGVRTPSAFAKRRLLAVAADSEDVLPLVKTAGPRPGKTGGKRAEEQSRTLLDIFMGMSPEDCEELLAMANRKRFERELMSEREDLTRRNALLRKQCDELRARCRSESEKRRRASTGFPLPLSDAKREFLKGISHGFRTSLTEIIGYVDILETQETEDGRRDCLRRVSEAAEELTAMLESQIVLCEDECEADAPVSLEPFNLNGLLINVVNAFSRKARRRGVDVNLVLDPDAPKTLFGDEWLLERILSNLIRVALRRVTGGAINLSVRLLGVRPDRCEIVFRLEFSGSSSRLVESLNHDARGVDGGDAGGADVSVEKGGDEGLELAASVRWADLLRGTLDVTRSPADGVVFTLFVPFPVNMERAVGERRGRFSRIALSRPLRALIVDDDPVSREIITGYLSQLRCQCDWVDNGRGALERCERESCDILFWDCRVSMLDHASSIGADGFKSFGDRLPIVAVTAKTSLVDRRRLRELGVSDCVTKPFRKSDVARVLKKFFIRVSSNASA